MVIPPAMQIEGAVDDLKSVDPAIIADQNKELFCATGKDNPDFRDGYNLGLQVARRMIFGSAELALKGADPSKVL